MNLEFYVARDDRGLHFFKDCPDLVKFNPYTEEIEWTGYPFDFGTGVGKLIRDCVENNPIVDNLEPYDAPLHLRLSDVKIFEID